MNGLTQKWILDYNGEDVPSEVKQAIKEMAIVYEMGNDSYFCVSYDVLVEMIEDFDEENEYCSVLIEFLTENVPGYREGVDVDVQFWW